MPSGDAQSHNPDASPEKGTNVSAAAQNTRVAPRSATSFIVETADSQQQPQQMKSLHNRAPATKLPTTGIKKLPVRDIEAQKVALEATLGEDTFLQLYKLVQENVLNEKQANFERSAVDLLYNATVKEKNSAEAINRILNGMIQLVIAEEETFRNN